MPDTTKRFRAIVLPLELVKQGDFATKIEHINMNISDNTQYLKKLIERNHEICYRSAKEVNKLISSTSKKINPVRKEEKYFLKFLNNLLEIHECMQKQISKVIVFINGKKFDVRKVNEVISPKLNKAGETLNTFLIQIREYNALDEKYTKKCDYFADLETNPIKYYSFGKNKQKYDKVKGIEEQLEQKLEQISSSKGEIRDMTVELSVKISQLYESIRLKIEELRRISRTVLDKTNEVIRGFDKIEEVSERAEEESESAISESEEISRNRESLVRPRDIRQLKKTKAAEYEEQTVFKSNILNFMSSFLGIINATIGELGGVINGKEFKKFLNEKAFMVELLPPRSNQDIDTILFSQQTLLNIYLGIQKIVAREVFEEIFKRQELYYRRFEEAINQIKEEEAENLNGGLNVRHRNIREIEKKYCQEQLQWKRELDLNLKDIINRIRKEFTNRNQAEPLRRQDKKSDLFSQKYFEILKLSYFEHKKLLGPFARSEHIISYQQIIKSNRLKTVLLDFEDEKGKNPKEEQKKMRSKYSCCGLFRKHFKSSEQKALNKIKKTKQIDHYSCALKDGFMLYSGLLTIYDSYLRFKSSFNPNTFFGSTDIFLPKFEIYEFIKGRHIMSLLITVVAKRGSIQFTSFFADPFDLLVEVFMSNRNTEYEIATHQIPADNDTIQKPELEELKLKMQTEFGEIATQEKFNIRKVNVSTRPNQLEIEYLYEDEMTTKSNEKLLRIPYSFRVSVKQYENSLQYLFWHCQDQTLIRKKKLQMIAKNLIKQERVQKFDNFAREIREREKVGKAMDDNISFNMGEQISIIGEKEKHRFDISDFGPQNINRSKKNFESTEWANLLQQTRNISQIATPMAGKASMDRKYFVKSQKILEDLQPEIKVDKDSGNQKRECKEGRRPDSNELSLLADKESQLSSIGLAKVEDTNKRVKVKTDGSVCVSENASTVKLGEKYAQAPAKKDGLVEIDQKVKEEGTKNLFMLMGVAFGLICILKLFV